MVERWETEFWWWWWWKRNETKREGYYKKLKLFENFSFYSPAHRHPSTPFIISSYFECVLCVPERKEFEYGKVGMKWWIHNGLSVLDQVEEQNGDDQIKFDDAYNACLTRILKNSLKWWEETNGFCRYFFNTQLGSELIYFFLFSCYLLPTPYTQFRPSRVFALNKHFWVSFPNSLLNDSFQ